MEIVFKDVCFSYQKVNYIDQIILDKVNFKFKKSKINGIVGGVGSGKTTILQLISAILKPTSGKILSDNIDINSKNFNLMGYKFNVGFVMQNPEESFFNETVKEEIAYSMKLYHYRLNELDKRVSNSLKIVGLDNEYLNRNPFTLSSCEKRKVAIACALINNPKVIILDEPIIGLGSKEKKEIIKLIRLLKNRYKKTIIIASNDIDFIHCITDYIYVLGNKKIVLEGIKYDIFKNASLLKKNGIRLPKMFEFSNKVFTQKKVKIGYRDEMNDLIKDIYRFVK